VDEPIVTTFWTLTKEGEDVRVYGSPENIVMKSIPLEGIAVAALNRY
jgi:hypothetical protein